MAKNEIVSNAGPLINLSVMKNFDLLKRLFEKAYIPDAVYEEIVIGKNKPGEKEVEHALKEGWLLKHAMKINWLFKACLERYTSEKLRQLYCRGSCKSTE